MHVKQFCFCNISLVAVEIPLEFNNAQEIHFGKKCVTPNW